ncbi:hypothetical protein HMH01_06555 [Halovulum dunhuangense]|uniref:Uncharacterized protein n=1 Tax=Halovulum dunhuangense TaxID=1505036 RepID=A0A849L1G2_9RHOB|nr:hypothetical protein [Halovulum dunhuangense]NNU80095.1 hypothetical protein [Halovulum dunhuangense]
MPNGLVAALPALLIGLALAVAPPARAQTPDRLDAWLSGAEVLAGALDRTQFDLDALALEMALATPEEIAARVDALVATQIYPGALRGAEGSLAAGSGNSLDQALLTIRLLTDAGYETRLARARLGDEDAARLLAAGAAPQRPPALADPATAAAALDGMGAAIEDPALTAAVGAYLDGPAALPDAPAEVRAQADRLIAALGDAMPGPAALGALMEDEARDYFWVQHRLFAGDDWQDLHTAFTPGTPLEPAEFVASPLPDDLLHRVEIRFRLVVRDGGRITETDLMSPVSFAPAAQGRMPLVFSILPDGVLKGEPDIFRAAPESTFFFPLLNGALGDRAMAFTREGVTAPAADVLAGGAMSDLIATVGARTSRAVGLLDSLGGGADDDLPPDTPVTEVMGLVMSVTHTPPFGAPRIEHVRHLADRRGADGRAEGAVLAMPDAAPPEIAVLGRWTLLGLAGGTGPAEVVAAQIDRALALRDAAPVADGVVPGQPTANPAQLLVTAEMLDRAAALGAGQGTTVYRAGPGLAMIHQTGRIEGDRVIQTAGIDILATARRALGPDGAPDPAAALRAGVAETLAETVLGTSVAPGTGPEALARIGSWEPLVAAPELRLARRAAELEDLPPGARAAAAADLARGAVLALATGGGVAWWRVDPVSGATIGVDALGRGAEAADYVSLVDAIITGVFIGYGASQCGGEGAAYACCVGTNFAFGMIGFAVLDKVAKGIVALQFADDVGAGLTGLAAGTTASATGWNPMSAICE